MTKVKLRTKPMTGKRHSLYLDFYPPIPHPDTGKSTRREFLGLYLIDKAKNPFDKQHNKETEGLAESIRAKRQIAIQNEQYGFLSSKKQNANFLNYFKELADKHQKRNRDIWLCALHYLEQFTGGTLRFADLNAKFCNNYREYLLKAPRMKNANVTISQNTAYQYFAKLKAAVKQAFKDGLLATDFSSQIKGIKERETQRQFLTLDELNTLVRTDCGIPVLKRASVFAALTGLRFSDIQKMVWSEVQHAKAEGYFVQYRQQKTEGVEVLPISEQAYSLMGQRGKPDTRVFEGLQYSSMINFHLKRWILKAGITKNITFHCFRHTYAVLQLGAGTDIYTVSKMLGHRDLKTTQIYAKVMDAAKREAADKIQLDFEPK